MLSICDIFSQSQMLEQIFEALRKEYTVSTQKDADRESQSHPAIHVVVEGVLCKVKGTLVQAQEAAQSGQDKLLEESRAPAERSLQCSYRYSLASIRCTLSRHKSIKMPFKGDCMAWKMVLDSSSSFEFTAQSMHLMLAQTLQALMLIFR